MLQRILNKNSDWKNADKTTEILADALGKSKNLFKVLEEIGELQVAITQYQSKGGSVKYIKDEVCDVLIQLNKLIYMMDFSEEEMSNHLSLKIEKMQDHVNRKYPNL